jgi:predicted DNA-binding transcriptional regulator AlpA
MARLSGGGCPAIGSPIQERSRVMEKTNAPAVTGAPGARPHYTRHTLAERLCIGLSTLDRLMAAGKLPKPLRIGRSCRWPAAEIDAWEAANCPDAKRWEVLRRRTG